jgi:hypothetical protein
LNNFFSTQVATLAANLTVGNVKRDQIPDMLRFFSTRIVIDPTVSQHAVVAQLEALNICVQHVSPPGQKMLMTPIHSGKTLCCQQA